MPELKKICSGVSINRKEIREYKTRSRKTQNLDEVNFENKAVKTRIPQKIRGKNTRKNNVRKYEQGRVALLENVRNDGKPKKKKFKYTLRSHTRSKQTSHNPFPSKKKTSEENRYSSHKISSKNEFKLCVNVVQMQASLKVIKTQMLAINIGIKKTVL